MSKTNEAIRGGYAFYLFVDERGTLHGGYIEHEALVAAIAQQDEDGEPSYGGAEWSATNFPGEIDAELIAHIASELGNLHGSEPAPAEPPS